MRHPCAKCVHAEHFPISKGVKHYHHCIIKECDRVVKYRENLHSKRKYEQGERISYLSQLLEKEMVFMYGRGYHIEAVKSLPLRVVLGFLKDGRIFEAVKKGDKKWQMK